MKPGTKLKSVVCDTEVMVIRAGDAVVDCGGKPMAEERPAERAALLSKADLENKIAALTGGRAADYALFNERRS